MRYFMEKIVKSLRALARTLDPPSCYLHLLLQLLCQFFTLELMLFLLVGVQKYTSLISASKSEIAKHTEPDFYLFFINFFKNEHKEDQHNIILNTGIYTHLRISHGRGNQTLKSSGRVRAGFRNFKCYKKCMI